LIYKLLVLKAKELIKIVKWKVHPAIRHQLAHELLACDRISIETKHRVVEGFDNGVKNDLIWVHLLLVELNIWPTVKVSSHNHALLHELKNSCQICEKEDWHADVFVDDKHTVCHFRLHHAVKGLCFLGISAFALKAADQDECIHADPGELTIHLELFQRGLLLNLKKKVVDDRVIVYGLCPSKHARIGGHMLSGLSKVFRIEHGTDWEICNEGASQENTLDVVCFKNVLEDFCIFESFFELIEVDKAVIFLGSKLFNALFEV
jgi:hypothetical protein